MNQETIFNYHLLSKELLHVVAILLIAWLLLALSRKLIRLFRNYVHERADSVEDEKSDRSHVVL